MRVQHRGTGEERVVQDHDDAATAEFVLGIALREELDDLTNPPLLLSGRVEPRDL